MLPMLALALLLPTPGSPVVPGTGLPPAAQWAAIEACPAVAVAGGGASGSGCVAGVRDGFAYVLTAAHVVPFDGITVRFTTREKFPADAWFADRPEVVARWPVPDLALVRFPTGGRAVPALPLAPPGARPKPVDLPAAVWGVAAGAAVWPDEVTAKRMLRRPDDGLVFLWESRRPPIPGRSGGPLLDAAGRVVGVCDARQHGRGYYIHLDEIHAALAGSGYGWLVPKGP